MSSLNLLSVGTSQGADIKGNGSEKAIDRKTTESSFSDIVERHSQDQKASSSNENAKASGNSEPRSKNEPAEPQPILDPKKDTTDKEKIGVIGKKKGDEHTLPVPIEPAVDDIENGKGGGDVHILPVISLTAEKNSQTNKNQADSHITKGTAPASTLLAPDTGSTDQQPTESSHDDAVDLLNMLNGAQKLLSKVDGEEAQHSVNKEQAQQKLRKEQALTSEPLLKSNNASAGAKEQGQVSQKNSEGIKLEPQANTENNRAAAKSVDAVAKSVDLAEQKNAEQIAKEQAQSSESNKMVNLTSNEASKKVNVELDKLQNDALAQAELKSEQGNAGEEEQEPSSKNESSERQFAASKGQSENQKPTSIESKAQVSVTSEKDAQMANQTPSQSSLKQSSENNDSVSDVRQQRAINQSTASVIAPTTKEQANPAAFNGNNSANSDDSLAAKTGQVEEESKMNAEKPAIVSERAASMVNQTIEAQANRPAMNAAEIAMQQEQSFESVMSKLTSNTVQSQKSITTLNTETIAIYRKDFADAVKDKVMVMINQKIQQVEIQLDPPEMGNVHVRVNLQNEQAAVQFVVQNQQAKEALEQNMGKLRDMLAENGVDVGDANIEQRQPGEQSQSASGEAGSQSGNNNAEQELDENQRHGQNVVKASSTGVDYYA